VGDFTLPTARFLHVHIDLIGPLLTSAGYTYCLTAVDRFTRWPGVIPIPNITAETVARALLTRWISRFGCQQTITIDQGRQFESQLFHPLAKFCGIHLTQTTPYNLAANGLVERFHRTLKAAIMCHADKHWTEKLPLVLLGIRTTFKADLQASTGELVYGKVLRIACELLTQTSHPDEPAHLITQLRQHMPRLRPVPATRHASPGTLCTRTSITAHTSSSVRTQHVELWSLLTAAHTRSCLGKRKLCSSLCAASQSPSQPTGSSRPTYSTRPTSGTLSATL
jgi:hypothetical protein